MRASDKRPAGFTIIEMVAVIAVLAVVSGLAIAAIGEARKRLRAATRAAVVRKEMTRARARLAGDIHAARAASTDGQGLSLLMSDDSRITWDLDGGSLTRAAGEARRVYRAPVEDLRISVDSEGTNTAFVEVGAKIKPASGEKRWTFYVAARTRIGEARR